MPPGAEEFILNSYVLTQSDRLAAFPQWFCHAGEPDRSVADCILPGSENRAGQWLAAGFAATIPMGIVEASSTINDYVATFWVVCVVVECLAYYKHGENRSLVYISLAAGLALLTKPVVVPFLIPFALWLAYLLVKRHGFMTIVEVGRGCHPDHWLDQRRLSDPQLHHLRRLCPTRWTSKPTTTSCIPFKALLPPC